MPLVYLDKLPVLARAGTLFEPPAPPPPPRPMIERAVKLVRVPVAQFLRTGVLFAPISIPPKPVMVDDGGMPPVDYEGGVSGGTGIPMGAFGGVVSAIASLRFTPPPAPPVVEARTEAAPPAPVAPVAIGGKVLEAKIINRVIPTYPALAKQARIQGTVRLQGIIGTDGRIQQLTVISGHPLLVKAAVDAVQQWLYAPTLLNDKPVAVTAPIDVHFTLSQ